MTAFSMRACASIADLARQLFLLLALVSFTALAADESRITHAEIVEGEGGYVLNADIELDLNSRLTDAVTRGVALFFVAEVIIERPRWYWMNEVVAERELNYRISYHAITRSYRLSIGSLHQSFDSLDSALLTMQRIRNWQVAGLEDLTPGVSHEASLRFRLDTAQLPKPFQVTAIGSREWNVGTDWLRWTFLPGAATSR
ncbi:DUF4390 domain-containing protein [Azoarcus sp. L1K30]|uniref:DUF4390 domain-containing protein n=1 Tax=Azoarcus sp. L1K30 TaxID=2820277 RepID=UPI0020133723|nr:DUF4390 domain-containing protein [Azoarcus sp. L1K30]